MISHIWKRRILDFFILVLITLFEVSMFRCCFNLSIAKIFKLEFISLSQAFAFIGLLWVIGCYFRSKQDKPSVFFIPGNSKEEHKNEK